MTRFCLIAVTFAFSVALVGCTSEYATLPEPSGQWVPAFPPPPVPLAAAEGTAQ